jgi:hypothetical protein
MESESGVVDVGIVFDTDDHPIMILPLSQRAKALFYRWGMDADADGIHPPENAMDLIDSVPRHWISSNYSPEKDFYVVQEVPLPQPRIVVH